MSDRSYPDTVDVRVDGRQRYRGCGAPMAYFEQTGETGQPNYPAQPNYPGQPNYPAPGTPGVNYPAPGAPGANYPAQGAPGANYPAPGAPGAMMLSGTNWRVMAINGRPTPRSNFYMNFMPDRIGAKFGCNSLGAGYSQTGPTLNVGAIMATRMACPDMSFENEGSAVLAQPMTVSGFGNHLTLTNRAGSIDLVRAN
jgi:heat shock protein HslJ